MAISLDDHHRSLARFVERVPALLAQNEATQAQAAVLAALASPDDDVGRARFTVAIMGRMKAGKSTLLNALIGRTLAPVGVDPTTATVNLFDRGPEMDEPFFDIYWKDPQRPVERRPLAAVVALTGRSEEAKLVEHLHFPCDSAFLRDVRIIDAPGTMSTIDSHEDEAINLVTRRYGARADATILVLPPVQTAADKKLLVDFAEQTRFPGQGPYNTLAVLQRWEGMEGIPEESAAALARVFRDGLRQHVSDVIPVSGLLAIMAERASDDTLDQLAWLGNHADPDELERLTGTETRFLSPRDGTLDAAARQALFEALRTTLLGAGATRAAGTFEMLSYALLLAARRSLSTAPALRQALHAASNIDQLREMLERRFFAASTLIQAGSTLKKRLEPCASAQLTLRDDLAQRRRLIDDARKLLADCPPGLATGPGPKLIEYLRAAVSQLESDLASVAHCAGTLDELVRAANEDLQSLIDDIGQLGALGDPGHGLAAKAEDQARRLFGQYGFDIASRLGLAPDAPAEARMECARALHARFFDLAVTNRIARQAEARLCEILDALEAADRRGGGGA